MRQMLKDKGGLQIGAFAALFSVTFCCIILVILLLFEEKTQRAGVATLSLTFNISDILNIPDLHLKQRGVPSPLGSLLATATAEGASLVATATAEGASLVATATVAGASLVAGATSAAGTAETAIEALLPRNLSLGISQFCVGFTDHTNCANLPLNITDIIPEAIKQFSVDIQDFVAGQFQTLQYLEGITAKVTSVNIKGPVVVGLQIT
ncbi:hypothetical protein B0J14DRAFT_659130 [Halenospora varia]|nr:hypothetical protein B0J14DRAFT_659130 [Halenospora varia]